MSTESAFTRGNLTPNARDSAVGTGGPTTSISEPGTAPPSGAQEQGPAGQPDSGRRRWWWALAAGSAVAAAALAAGLTLARPGTPATPSPLSAVTGALAQTTARSYTFSLDTTVRSSRQELNSDRVSGAFDVRRHLGTESLAAGAAGQTRRAQSRFIGAYVYTTVFSASGFGKLWDKSPLAAAAAAGMPTGDPYGFVSDQPFSPTELDVVLRAPGAVVHDSGPVSGPGWTGTGYTLTASLSEGRESVRGTADVDRQGRVRRITTTTEERGQASGKVSITTVRQVTFGAFGVPVRVIAPPASEVKYSSGTPYWGFYF
jgi:hypothetical protein